MFMILCIIFNHVAESIGLSKVDSPASLEQHRILSELVINSRVNADPKMRLMAMQWSRVLFKWQAISMETMTLLAGIYETAA
jgi:hypothetical protein